MEICLVGCITDTDRMIRVLNKRDGTGGLQVANEGVAATETTK